MNESSLTDAERTLLALVREGRMDAEIAVRLGLPTGEVKARIEALCSKVGAKDRAGLRDGVANGQPPTPVDDTSEAEIARPRPGRRTVAAMFVAALAVVVAGGWLVTRDDNSAATATPTGTPFDAARATASAQLAAVTPASVVTPVATIVDGRQMYDLGQMFVVSGHPFDAVADVDAREALTVAYFAGAGVARLDGGNGVKWSFAAGTSNYRASFVMTLGTQQIELTVNPADEHTHLVSGASDSVAFYNDSGGQPALMLQAATFRISFLWHVTVNASGELFLATAPISTNLVIPLDTGQLLDVRNTERLAWGVAGAWTNCGTYMPVCDVIARPPSSSPVRVPVDGVLICRADGVLELDTNTFQLEFHRLSGSGPDDPGCDPPPNPNVKLGDSLGAPAPYRITASRPDGTPLDVVVSGDGTLFVGTVAGRVDCPCLGGD